MRRAAAVLVTLAAAALAGPSVHLVDGSTLAAELVEADASQAVLKGAEGVRRVPTRTIVSASLDASLARPATSPFNLYLPPT